MQFFLGALGISAAVGFGCGSTCGSSASVFLLSYLVSSEKSGRENTRYTLIFYLGKCIAISLLCILSSIVGSRIITAEMAESSFLKHCFPMLVLIASVGMLINLLDRSRKRKGCVSCGKCGAEGTLPYLQNTGRFSVWMLLLMGMVYGVTPCAPLLLVLGYAVLLPVYGAICLGLIFSIASCITPGIVVLGLGNFLSKKIMLQIQEQRRHFQAGIYLFLIAMALVLILC